MKHPPITSMLKALICAICAISFFSSAYAATEVEAEGRAAGDQRSARGQALAEALREAVRVGVGVDVLSSSSVSDFALEYDRIMSSAFGHVKTYKILSSGLGQDQIYRVKIKATVVQGAPDAQNILALRQILELKGAPRVSINIEEQIDGAPGKTKYAQGIMEQTARELQFKLVDPGIAHTYERKMAKRDEILGNERNAKLRTAGISQKSDFLIEGRIVARYVGQQSFYGSLAQHVYSIGGELRAIRPETGEIVATTALPGMENVESELESKEMAARDVIQKVLASVEKRDGLPPLFNKVIAEWVAETDLGAIKRIEVTGIPNEEYRKLQELLNDTEKVSAVWPREFDSQGLSFMDIETRLDNSSIEEKVANLFKDKIAIDRSTENLIAFKYGEKSIAREKPVEKRRSWWPF
jgi:hypothetical protein